MPAAPTLSLPKLALVASTRANRRISLTYEATELLSTMKVGKYDYAQPQASLLAVTEAEHEVEGRFPLDVVIREGAAILELLAREDQTLLVGRDALLVLDLWEGRGTGVLVVRYFFRV